MKLKQVFEVARPPEEVWASFQDVPSVAQCLPGAELTEDRGDGTYAGRLEAKMGPMSVAFEGEARIETDAEAKTGTMKGTGVDRRGGSRGRVTVDYTLTAQNGSTMVAVEADITLSGPAAQFGRTGLIKEMSSRLVAEFVECLEAKLAASSVEEAATIEAGEVKGLSLFFSSLWIALRRFFRGLFRD